MDNTIANVECQAGMCENVTSQSSAVQQKLHYQGSLGNKEGWMLGLHMMLRFFSNFTASNAATLLE